MAVVHSSVRELFRGSREGRGKAQAESLRKARQDTPAKRIKGEAKDVQSALSRMEVVSSTALRKND